MRQRLIIIIYVFVYNVLYDIAINVFENHAYLALIFFRCICSAFRCLKLLVNHVYTNDYNGWTEKLDIICLYKHPPLNGDFLDVGGHDIPVALLIFILGLLSWFPSDFKICGKTNSFCSSALLKSNLLLISFIFIYYFVCIGCGKNTSKK